MFVRLGRVHFFMLTAILLLLFVMCAFVCPVCRRDVDMYRAMTKVQWNYDTKPPEISGCILKFL